MMHVVTILSAWLLADFFGGIIHWAEDRLLTEETRFKFLNVVKYDNDLHHAKPGSIVNFSFWDNIRITVMFTAPLTLILFLSGAPMVFWLAALFASFGNGIHKWSHTPKRKLPKWIRFMQLTGLFISFEQHHAHHFNAEGIIKKEDTTGIYCPMTSWLNPALDMIGFFPFLERFFLRSS